MEENKNSKLNTDTQDSDQNMNSASKNSVVATSIDIPAINIDQSNPVSTQIKSDIDLKPEIQIAGVPVIKLDLDKNDLRQNNPLQNNADDGVKNSSNNDLTNNSDQGIKITSKNENSGISALSLADSLTPPVFSSQDSKKTQSASADTISVLTPADSTKSPETTSSDTKNITKTVPLMPPVLESKNKEKSDSKEAKNDFFASISLGEKSGKSSSGAQKIIDSATKNALTEKADVNKILGNTKILQQSIENEAKTKEKRKLRAVKIIFAAFLLMALSINAFLYYQLSPELNFFGLLKYEFSGNLTGQMNQTNQDLRSINTRLNKYKYLTAQLYLNQFNLESVRLTDSVRAFEISTNQTQRTNLKNSIDDMKIKLPDYLASIKNALETVVAIDTFKTRTEKEITPGFLLSQAQTDLRASIFREKEDYVAEDAQKFDPQDQMIIFYDNAAKLVGNSLLLSTLNKTDIKTFSDELATYIDTKDPLQREEFREKLNNLLSVAKSDLAIITKIKEKRIEWSKVIDGIQRVTNNVDSQFRRDNSKTVYTNFDLDSRTGRIIASGSNTTSSQNNREVMATLIDKFNDDAQFKNAVNRSFPLNRSEDQDRNEIFTMNFRLEFEIKPEGFISANVPVSAGFGTYSFSGDPNPSTTQTTTRTATQATSRASDQTTEQAVSPDSSKNEISNTNETAQSSSQTVTSDAEPVIKEKSPTLIETDEAIENESSFIIEGLSIEGLQISES